MTNDNPTQPKHPGQSEMPKTDRTEVPPSPPDTTGNPSQGNPREEQGGGRDREGAGPMNP